AVFSRTQRLRGLGLGKFRETSKKPPGACARSEAGAPFPSSWQPVWVQQEETPGRSRGYVPNTQLRQVIQELCGFPVQREGVLALHILHRLVQLRHLRNNSCSFRYAGSCRVRTIN
ncbi:unnamed protein product, partial [Ectocarpus sp. 4 AP-2014]